MIDMYTGVPQGSRLLPLLFICLMADLDLWTKESTITNFADDTQSVIIKDGKDEAVDTAKKEANSVIEFFENNNFVNNLETPNMLKPVLNSRHKICQFNALLEMSLDFLRFTIYCSYSVL